MPPPDRFQQSDHFNVSEMTVDRAL